MKTETVRGINGLRVPAAAGVLICGLLGFICYDSDPGLPAWPMWGGDIRNTHHAVNESIINVGNVRNLAPLWTLNTFGSVSAIPTVTETRVYFPSWGIPWLQAGSMLYAVDRDTGRVLMKKPVMGYTRSLINTVSRSSPAIYKNLIIIGDQRNLPVSGSAIPFGKGATIYGINRTTGALVWESTIDRHPFAVVTGSPTVYEGRVYVGVSSHEEPASKIIYKCCSFHGSLVCLDAATGRLLWKTYTIPKTPAYKGFTGAAVWCSNPSIDETRRLVYFGTGNNYTVSGELGACLKEHRGAPREQQEECYDRFDLPENYADSLLACDLDTGEIRWSLKLQNFGAWTYACDPRLVPWLPVNLKNCQDLTSLDFDFGQAPMLFSTSINGLERDVLAVGQKSGVVWLIDPDTGTEIWHTAVSPGGVLGGPEFGSATDGTRIYVQATNIDHIPFQLVAGPHAGRTVNGGIWAALDAATGTILWQTPDPSSFRPLVGGIQHPVWGAFKGPGFFGCAEGPLTIANGVLFAGSLDREGHMYALDAETGEILWSFESGGSVMSAPAVVDGVLYWGSGYYHGFSNNKFFAFALR